MVIKQHIDNKLGPDGARSLAPALREMPQLTTLNLAGKLL